MSNLYQDHGYDSRRHYLESLSEDYGVPLDTVLTVADLLGPIEDFDGLVSTLQDYDSEKS